MANEKKMVEQITSMEEDFAKWYTDIVKKADLIDYSSVKGCMIIRPYGYAIWENIQKLMDARFKATGVENIYMPMFIPESLLNKEKDHVEGFAPEYGAGNCLQLRSQVAQGNGTVLRQPGEGALLRPEEGIVDLSPAGIHAGADRALPDAQAQRHGLQGADTHQRQVAAPGEALGRGHADAHTGKGAGSVGNCHMGHCRYAEGALLQQVLRHDQQGLAMGKAGILVAFRQQLTVLPEADGGGFGRGLKG